ncbi:hypothetical protein K8R32_05065 [bacterium]|nr:hypothetical protein [bacterium]
MKKIFGSILILSFFSITLLSFSCPVKAGVIEANLRSEMSQHETLLRNEAGFSRSASIGKMAHYVIKGFLSVLGIIFIILLILAGYNWMTAAGDEAKVTKAKDTIQKAIIGLIIIVSAYAITAFVFINISGDSGGSSFPL